MEGFTMIYDFYADIEKEVLINFATNTTVGLSGIKEINRLFSEVKEHVFYENSIKLQKASETQVLGGGNNFSKNILLYSLLKICGYHCDLKYYYVKDTTGKICSKGLKAYPWFFVTVDFCGTTISLDGSFNKEYMKAMEIAYVGDSLDFKPENYLINKSPVFEKYSDSEEIKDLKVIDLLKTAGNYGVFSRDRGISYV